jgi:hypothetical protein
MGLVFYLDFFVVVPVPGRGTGPAFLPLLKQFLAFARRLAVDQIFGADIFIQIRPVDSFSLSVSSPIDALFGCAMQQARILVQRCADGAAITKFNS